MNILVVPNLESRWVQLCFENDDAQEDFGVNLTPQDVRSFVQMLNRALAQLAAAVEAEEEKSPLRS